MRKCFAVVIFSMSLAFMGPDSRWLLAADPPPSSKGTPSPSETITGILGAMAMEMEQLEAQLTDKKVQKLEDVSFIEGRLKGKKVVLAHSGVGKVNAAMTTTLLLEHFRPARVLMTGVAGGLNPDLHPGDIVIGAKIGHHDFGTLTPKGLRVGPTRNPLTRIRNPVYFPADENLLAAAEQAAASVTKEVERSGSARIIKTGIIVTGDTFVTSTSAKLSLRQDHQADATEMEGAAVAQICWQRRVPCLVIRSISDNADEKANEEFEKFAKMSADHSALVIVAILQRLN